MKTIKTINYCECKNPKLYLVYFNPGPRTRCYFICDHHKELFLSIIGRKIIKELNIIKINKHNAKAKYLIMLGELASHAIQNRIDEERVIKDIRESINNMRIREIIE